MSFNRRGPDRRPDRDRSDRPQRKPGGDWQPRERAGGDRPPYQSRDRQGGGDRPPYQPRGGDRPFTPRPRFDRPPDEGAMSIRLDPRRVNALKHLAGEAGVRPGDLVRQWVEERIDGSRGAAPGAEIGLADQLAALVARVDALEAPRGSSQATERAESAPASSDEPTPAVETAPAKSTKRHVRAAPAKRVALHDEMIAVLSERGPMTAAELATAVAERGRYAPPRSGKPLDAAMISQRVSNPTYRARFTRAEGRIGLAS